MEIYVVKEGDSVDSIAAAARTPVETLIWENQIEYPYRLAVGQALYISGNSTGRRMENNTGDGAQIGNSGLRMDVPVKTPLYVFGYAYPFINAQTLRDTLPHITDLYVFSYGFTENGTLVPPAANDTWMIHEALKAGVGPVLTLTPLGADGKFNNNLVANLVHNPDARQRLIWELGRTMQEGEFVGLDLDFEYVQSGDREAYADFVRQVTGIMNQFEYEVTVAMAPINMVRRVVDYAVSEIPREKISLGIPNYGYDWPLPYERGITRARTINNLEVERRW